MIVLYHKTTATNAAAILADGFRDNTDSFMTDGLHTGCWLSDRPPEDAPGDTVVAVLFDLPDSALCYFEWREPGKGYREWLIPAQFILQHGEVQLMSAEDTE